MALATKTLALTTTPLNLSSDVDVAAELANGPVTLALQNTDEGKIVYFADRDAAPADGSRDGLLLRFGDTVIFSIDDKSDALWCWTPSLTGASMSVTNAG